MKLSTRLLALSAVTAAAGMALAADPTVDGVMDPQYTQLAVQNTQTGWGDSNLGQVGPANGSELDNIAYYRTATDLYLFIGGNMENAPGVYQKCALFLDSRSGGYNRLPAGLPDIDFNRFIRMADDGSGNGLTFDSGFDADEFFAIVCGGNSEIYLNYSQVETTANGGVGFWMGGGSCGSDGTLSGGNNPFNALVTVNNSNVAGVTGGIGTDPGNGATVTTGIEIRIPLAQIGDPTGAVKVCAFIFSDGYDFCSNQWLGGIGGGDNLGDPRFINASVISGDQYVTVPPASTTETLAPTAEQFVRGQGIAGTLASWAADDNDPRNVRKFIVINQTEAFIRVNLDYTTTKANPTAISFVSKARMLDGGVFRISMSLRNDANAFVEVLPETAIGLSFATFTGNATGTLTDYVGNAGEMRGQIAVRQAGPSTAILPRSSFETGNMVVTG